MSRIAAIDPEWFWSEDRTLYHVTPLHKAEQILQQGLLPWDVPISNPPGSVWEGDEYQPRSGHVYFATSLEAAQNIIMWADHPRDDLVILAIDGSFLDPYRINPDEDYLAEDLKGADADAMRDQVFNGNWLDYGELMGQPREEGGKVPPRGEVAEQWNFRDPEITQGSWEQRGMVAYKGAVPPEAISVIPEDQWKLDGLLRDVWDEEKVAKADNNWADLHAEFKLPKATAKTIREWVNKLEWPAGAEKESRDRYHITIVSVDNPEDKAYEEMLGDWRDKVKGCTFTTTDLDLFGDVVVLKLQSDEWKSLAKFFAEKADEYGLDPRRFPGGARAHISLGTAKELPKIPEGEKLELEFSTADFNINKNSAKPPTWWEKWKSQWAKRKQLTDDPEKNPQDPTEELKPGIRAKVAFPSRPEGEWPQEWQWPEYPEHLYHATPLSKVEQIKREGLKPQVSDAQREIWPDAQPFIHAHDDVDELLDRFGEYLYGGHGEPFTLLKVPAKRFRYWQGVPDEEWGASDDESGREQFTWFADQPIPPEEIQVVSEVVWPELDHHQRVLDLQQDELDQGIIDEATFKDPKVSVANRPKNKAERKMVLAPDLEGMWEELKAEWAERDDGEGQALPDHIQDDPEHWRHDHLPHLRGSSFAQELADLTRKWAESQETRRKRKRRNNNPSPGYSDGDGDSDGDNGGDGGGNGGDGGGDGGGSTASINKAAVWDKSTSEMTPEELAYVS